MELDKIYNEDCLQVMKEMPDESKRHHNYRYLIFKNKYHGRRNLERC